MMKKLSMTVVSAIAGLSAGAWADTAPAGPGLDKVLAASGITEQGYIEAAYNYYSYSAPGGTNLAPTGMNYFDNRANSFDLKQAFLQLAKQPAEGVGGLVNITTGSDADWIKSAPYSQRAASNSFDLTQAFLQYAHGIYTASAGKFVTMAGAEVINDLSNTNISHSIAFLNAIPFTHTGARFTIAPNSTYSIMLGEVNGWDQQQAYSAQKTTEWCLLFNPTAMVSWSLQGYYGDATPSAYTPTVANLVAAPATANGKLINNKTVSGILATRNLVDTVLTVKPTAALSLILNADYAKQDRAFTDNTAAVWTAVDVYVNYQFNDQWRTSLRLENFDDKEGYKLGYGVGNTKSSTLTVGYAPIPAFEVRAEVREDKAPQAVIPKGSGVTDSVGYAAVEGIYKF